MKIARKLTRLREVRTCAVVVHQRHLERALLRGRQDLSTNPDEFRKQDPFFAADALTEVRKRRGAPICEAVEHLVRSILLEEVQDSLGQSRSVCREDTKCFRDIPMVLTGVEEGAVYLDTLTIEVQPHPPLQIQHARPDLGASNVTRGKLMQIADELAVLPSQFVEVDHQI